MTVDELNEIARQVDKALDAYIAGRNLNAGLRGSLFLAIEKRALRGLQPAFSDEHRAIIDAYAEA